MYDVIIIGAGPAGFTAAIYAARREMKTLIIGREIGGQVLWASEIENYPGFKSIKNYELIAKMEEQIKGLGVEIANSEVQKIDRAGDGSFLLHTTKKIYQTKTIILATGLVPRRLAIKGEVELMGKGVSYCANCDGPFFKNKTVAVVGGGNAALDAAEVLSKIAGRVYLIHRRQEFRGFEGLVAEVKKRENIELILDSEIKEIIGESKVEKIITADINSGESRETAVDGVFIEIGRIANTDLVADLVERNDKDQIVIDEKCRTKTEGIFAAGDVTNGPFKQITIACGQGTIAALAAYEYLQLKEGNKAGPIFDRGRR